MVTVGPPGEPNYPGKKSCHKSSKQGAISEDDPDEEGGIASELLKYEGDIAWPGERKTAPWAVT